MMTLFVAFHQKAFKPDFKSGGLWVYLVQLNLDTDKHIRGCSTLRPTHRIPCYICCTCTIYMGVYTSVDG